MVKRKSKVAQFRLARTSEKGLDIVFGGTPRKPSRAKKTAVKKLTSAQVLKLLAARQARTRMRVEKAMELRLARRT